MKILCSNYFRLRVLLKLQANRYVIQQLVQRMSQNTKSNSFIAKFHSILKNPSFQDIIKLDKAKAKITIYDKTRFKVEILPFYFRHANFSSFVRQLNLYGFNTIKKEENFCFTHPVIQKGGEFPTIIAKRKLKGDYSHQRPQNAQPQTHQSNLPASYCNLSVVSNEFEKLSYLFMKQIFPKSHVSSHVQLSAASQRQQKVGNANIWNFYPSPSICFTPMQFGFSCSPFYISGVSPPN